MIVNLTHPRDKVIYAVSELNQMVASLLTDCFPALKVIGEVSNFSCPHSGHWYFSLKDEKAQVRCVFFQGKQRANSLNLRDGMQVILKARLRLYETRGDFQLTVEDIESVGDGILRQKFELLKTNLAKEGLFARENKKQLPSFIRTIGIVTSATGAAIRDILIILKRRFPTIAVIIYPSSVQGKGAAEQIVKQITIANFRQECQTLIVTRGGGSLEDLWPFNEEIVARAIAESHIPVISAVGHEVDITIADFVADIRVATPSAAAELVSPDQNAWKQRLEQLEVRLVRAIKKHLENYQKNLLHLRRRLKHPGQHLQNCVQRVDELEQRLNNAMKNLIKLKKQQIVYWKRVLDTINPLATLTRGYALVKKHTSETVLRSADQVEVGELVTAQLAKGEILCRVEKRILP